MGSADVYDVFVSYARSDEAVAAELNGWLCAQGLRTFFDRNALKPGLRWVPALEDTIGRSRAVAILFGRHGIGNTQQYERELALVRQTTDPAFPVIPVLMPGCESPPTGFLQLLTWIDLSKGTSVLPQSDSLAALRGALGGEHIPSAVRRSICPYRGLEPFREEDAPFFSGRDDAIRDLVTKVEAHAFVVVVGPSGSGKSSLVLAGLLPALRKQRHTAMWDVVTLRPGASPLRGLAVAFGAPPENAGPAAIDSYLEREADAYRGGDTDKLARIVNDRLDTAPERPDRLLIYVDQWEELYAMAPGAEDVQRVQEHANDADKFIALLASASVRAPVSVVLTIRADFYNPLIRNPFLSALLPRQQVNIKPMGVNDLRSAIENPATMAGLSFTPPKLVDQILNDVGTQEGRLPLLQFALKETWERREGNSLTAEAYTEVGGVTGAIEKTAETAYERLTDPQKDAARRLFLRLVTPGEGQEDTRARSEIPDDLQQREVIKRFSDPKIRLLVTGFARLHGPGQAGSDGRATVEVAHEALIQRWHTLRAWVAQNRENLRARAAVLRALAEWEENGGIDKFLLDPGVQLERGRALVESPGDVPVDDVRHYVELSIKREEGRVNAEREAYLADQKRIADAERKAREAAEEVARQAGASAKVEIELRTTAEQKTLAEQGARLHAESSAGKLRAALIAAVIALGIAAVAFYATSQEVDETQRQLVRANHISAQSINRDLAGPLPRTLSARERNALWNLAQAEEGVKYEFVSKLADSPEEIARVSDRFALIFRALGLLGPSPFEALELLHAASDSSDTGGPLFAKILDALPTEPDRSALDRVLKDQHDSYWREFRPTNDPISLDKNERTTNWIWWTGARRDELLDPLLDQIEDNTDPRALGALAKALEALAPKLTEPQARKAANAAASSLAWAADEEEATDWARALVALLSRTAEPNDSELVTAIAYPTAAGSATEVLLDALRARHPGAPQKEAGTKAAFAWLAANYPWVRNPQICPPPRQLFAISGLRCPFQETESRQSTSGTTSK